MIAEVLNANALLMSCHLCLQQCPVVLTPPEGLELKGTAEEESPGELIFLGSHSGL